MYGPLLIPELMSKIPDEINLINSHEFSGTDDSLNIDLVLNSFNSFQTMIEFQKDFHFSASSLSAPSYPGEKEQFQIKWVFCDHLHKTSDSKIATNIDSKKSITTQKTLYKNILTSA